MKGGKSRSKRRVIGVGTRLKISTRCGILLNMGDRRMFGVEGILQNTKPLFGTVRELESLVYTFHYT